MMKKILLSITIIFSFSPIYAQYQTLYTSVTTINFFSKIKHSTINYDEIYFQPSGVSGAPCSVLDPNNSNIYRVIPHSGEIYRPFNGMLDRFICNDINGGCYPVGFSFFSASVYDTSLVIGYRSIAGNPQSPNCNQMMNSTFISNDGGSSYREIFPGKEIKGIGMLPLKSIVVVGTDSVIHRSTNNGVSFTQMGSVPGLQSPINVNFYKPYIILAAGSQNMYRSIDSGHTFTAMNVPVLKELILDDYQGATYYGVNNSNVYKGNSFGQSWSTLASFNNINCLELEAYTGEKKLYIGTDDGLYFSSNDGNTFRKSGLSFPSSNKIIGISKYNNSDTLIICTDKSIYKVWDIQTSINEFTNTVPSEYKLHANYPNPFNPSTNISFDIPERADVSLVIYDGMGKQVTELTNTTLITGKYTFTWDASYMSSGVYYARFTARGVSGREYVQTTKMLLLK